MMKNCFALVAAMASLTATGAQAANILNPGTGSPYVLTSTGYSQSFNSLKSVTSDPTTADTLPAGWQSYEAGSKADTTYQFGSASSNTAGVWSYGSGSDRALGGHASTEVSTIYVGAIFENGLSGVIDSLTLSYTGEQWQKGYNRATMVFEYSLDATSLDNGTWTSFSALDFLAPNATVSSNKFGISSTNGNNAAYRTSISGLIDGLSIGIGETFAIRWTLIDLDGPGVTSDDGLAIDDFRLSATLAPAAVPEPATWAMMIGGLGLVGATLRRKHALVRFA